jgi:predicted nucleotidyltransferase
VRIIYRHELDWYLTLSDKKDTLEVMDGDLDVTGWDIKKSLKLLWKSNSALFERIQSPIVYREERQMASLLQTYAEKCFSPVAAMYHYQGMARNAFEEVDGREEVKLKKLFYALRATLCCKWIVERDQIPPIIFHTLVEELDFEEGLKVCIQELTDLKAGKSEAYMHPAEDKLNAFIREELQKSSAVAASLCGRKEKEVDLDALFLKIVTTY